MYNILVVQCTLILEVSRLRSQRICHWILGPSLRNCLPIQAAVTSINLDSERRKSYTYGIIWIPLTGWLLNLQPPSTTNLSVCGERFGVARFAQFSMFSLPVFLASCLDHSASWHFLTSRPVILSSLFLDLMSTMLTGACSFFTGIMD